ncbi:MAG: hypothetical protein Q4B14_04275 [Clostridia bacterium]|nr:hypothetical protein [Clostridia bacterium]
MKNESMIMGMKITESEKERLYLDKNKIISNIAMGIRYLTIPPIMVSTLLSYLFLGKRELFNSATDFIMSIFFLAAFPILAYAVHFLVPVFKAKGRDLQRKMAFIFTGIGYVLATGYGFLAGCTDGLKILFVSLLIIYSININKVIKVKASGHSCGISGLLIFCAYFGGLYTIIFNMILYMLTLWASVRTKRHTKKEFILGSIICLVSFSVVAPIISLF